MVISPPNLTVIRFECGEGMLRHPMYWRVVPDLVAPHFSAEHGGAIGWGRRFSSTFNPGMVGSEMHQILHEFWENFRHDLFKPLLLFFYMGFLVPILGVKLDFPHITNLLL